MLGNKKLQHEQIHCSFSKVSENHKQEHISQCSVFKP